MGCAVTTSQVYYDQNVSHLYEIDEKEEIKLVSESQPPENQQISLSYREQQFAVTTPHIQESQRKNQSEQEGQDDPNKSNEVQQLQPLYISVSHMDSQSSRGRMTPKLNLIETRINQADGEIEKENAVEFEEFFQVFQMAPFKKSIKIYKKTDWNQQDLGNYTYIEGMPQEYYDSELYIKFKAMKKFDYKLNNEYNNTQIEGPFLIGDDTYYQGQIKTSGKNGYGILFKNQEVLYEGYFKDDVFCGFGRQIMPNETYIGKFLNGVREGKGTLLRPDNYKYIGQFKRGHFNGKGEETLPDGTYTKCNFRAGRKKCMEGVQVCPNGDLYEGGFLKDKYEGQGKLTYADGKVYEGHWKAGQIEGHGLMVYPNGTSYSGNFVNGIKNGKGVYKWADGTTYDGPFQNGKQHGRGKITNTKGETKEYKFDQGKRVQEKVEEKPDKEKTDKDKEIEKNDKGKEKNEKEKQNNDKEKENNDKGKEQEKNDKEIQNNDNEKENNDKEKVQENNGNEKENNDKEKEQEKNDKENPEKQNI